MIGLVMAVDLRHRGEAFLGRVERYPGEFGDQGLGLEHAGQAEKEAGLVGGEGAEESAPMQIQQGQAAVGFLSPIPFHFLSLVLFEGAD